MDSGQEKRVRELVEKTVSDPAKVQQIIDSISNQGQDYEQLASMSDKELAEMVEMEAKFLEG